MHCYIPDVARSFPSIACAVCTCSCQEHDIYATALQDLQVQLRETRATLKDMGGGSATEDYGVSDISSDDTE